MVNKNRILPLVLLIVCGFVAICIAFGGFQPKVHAAPIPAGCPGGPAGPPSPGTTCPTIPVGCPEGPPGNLAPGTVCPDTSAKYDPINNTTNKSSNQPKYVAGDCEGDAIRAGVKDPKDPNHCGILDYLTLFIKVLSGIVGVVVVAMIIIGGIQYSASGGDPTGVAAAKKRITNALLALALYFFIFAILQYLIPGGVIQ